MFRGIQHVALTVDDLDAARRFYEEGLGLEVLPRPDFGIGGMWYGVADGQAIHLVELGAATPTINHFALEVDDLDAVVAELATRGIVAKVGREIAGAGRQANITDPAGNLIELNQPPVKGEEHEEHAMATCTHLDTIQDVGPSGTGCVECLASGGHWVHLRMCQSCGHIGCCDNSPGRHATGHFHDSGHELIRSYEPGEDWFWCYVDDVAFELDLPPGPSHP